MPRRPVTVTVNYFLFLVNVLIWLVLGIIIVVNAHPALPVPPAMKAIVAGMSIVMAGILVCLLILLLRGSHKAYYFSLAFFGITALLTIFDDVGLSDVVVIVLNIIPIILLVIDRKWYLREQAPQTPAPQPPESQ